MSIKRGRAPTILTLYLTQPLSSSIINSMKRDFALAAHEDYHPIARLIVSPRTDFYGLAAEDVMRKLDEEHGEKIREEYEEDGLRGEKYLTHHVIIADENTTERGEIVYVHRWIDQDWFMEDDINDRLVPGEWSFPILEKQRCFIQEAPTIYANLSIGNISIAEQWQYPYDPTRPHPPPVWRTDWRLQSPGVAYVTAGPEDYEKNDRGEYRLKASKAAELNLVANWAIGWGAGDDDDENDEKKGLMNFAQPWKWEPPAL
ncbi:hypothetical protein BT69DRAFT_1355329 [Atractiella rhizophila]|nr:hypothetical protein BT69DRAFT_1355329 [Atractiella rhizophila]